MPWAAQPRPRSSPGNLDRPVAFAADFGRSAGELFTGSKVYPDPVVHRRDDRIDIRFFSGRGVIDHGTGSGNHIYRWHITGGPGRVLQWERDYIGYDGTDLRGRNRPALWGWKRPAIAWWITSGRRR